MRFTHSNCGGPFKERMKQVGQFRVFQGFVCGLCGKEFDESGINDLYLHGHMTPIPDEGIAIDVVMMDGFRVLKKAHDESIQPKRVRYPKKTTAYRRRQKRSEDA